MIHRCMECPKCGTICAEGLSDCPSYGNSLNSTLTGRIANEADSAIGPEGIAPAALSRTRISNRRAVVFLLCMFIILLIVFSIAVTKGVPIYIGVFFTILPLIFLGLILYQNRAVSRVDLSNPSNYYTEQLEKKYGDKAVSTVAGTNVFGNSAVQLQKGEEIITYASPVYRLQTSRSGLSNVSVERYTENTIIVTNQRVVFLTCPLPGQGLLLGGGSQDMWNDMLKRRTIQDMAQKRVEELKTGGSSDHFPNDFWIDRNSLTQVDYLRVLGPMKYAAAGAISFRVDTGNKVRYNVVEGSDIDRLVPVLNAVKKHVL